MLHADFRTPSLDYQHYLRATAAVTKDAAQVELAFRRSVFNVLFNNRDDHAKNFSYRMNEALQWQLSPAYDLTFHAGPGGYHQTSGVRHEAP
jgi:serine/threonine-protein kinase HipA